MVSFNFTIRKNKSSHILTKTAGFHGKRANSFKPVVDPCRNFNPLFINGINPDKYYTNVFQAAFSFTVYFFRKGGVEYTRYDISCYRNELTLISNFRLFFTFFSVFPVQDIQKTFTKNENYVQRPIEQKNQMKMSQEPQKNLKFLLADKLIIFCKNGYHISIEQYKKKRTGCLGIRR